MSKQENRWVLPDWPTTLKWCRKRNSQGIRCTIDVLGEQKRSEEEVRKTVESYTTIAKAISKENLKTSLAVKLTAIGAIFDKTFCKDNLGKVLEEASRQNVIVEIDMEGKPLVDFTLQTVISFSRKGFPITLTLQAYLDRTLDDLNNALKEGIKIRLVKGAYKGDLVDFNLIQKKFMDLTEVLISNGEPFFVGTHDPVIIEWMKEKTTRKKEFLEIGFLKGLADRTKLQLVENGWLVSEYVPFGSDNREYEIRRKNYLKELENLGKAPAH